MTNFFMHEQRYRDLNLVADRQITICGTGALGANLAESLARMGLRNLRVIDRDRIEPHNLSTQPWQTRDVGSPKVMVLAHMLYRAVGTRVDPQQVELVATNATKILKGSHLVVDAFDNIPGRRLVGEKAKEMHIPCLHLALGGSSDYGCGLWNDDYVLPDKPAGIDGCEYPLTRSLALMVAAAGSEVIARFLVAKEQHGFEVTLHDLRVMSTS
jgi:molybdopterin-synthase adenylyltransferase